jgi:hypothetical protein
MSSVIIAGNTSGTIELYAPDISGSSVLTFPVTTDTLVCKNTTDTLTNKTFVAPVLGTPTSGNLNNCIGLPTVGQKNYIINGNFDIWQRATTQTITGCGSSDRWNNSNTGSTKVTSRQTFTLGQTNVPNNPKYYSKTVVTSVVGANNFCCMLQKIESVITLSGQTATLSFWAKADTNKTIAVEFVQFFGTGGSPSASVWGINITKCDLTTLWQKFTVMVNFPSITGKTIGTNDDDNIQVVFWFDSGSSYATRNNSLGPQSGNFDISQVQLEAGSIATPFEYRHIQTELTLCQRYFITTYSDGVDPGTASTDSSAKWAFTGPTGQAISYIGVHWQYPVQMRRLPDITLYNPHTGATGTAFAQNAATSLSATAGGGNEKSMGLYLSGQTVSAADLIKFHATATAEL